MKISSLRSLGVLGCLALPPFAHGSTTWTGPTWNVSTLIPDYDAVGLTRTQAVSATGITTIENIMVRINLSGAWNGDLYAYLLHDDGFAVLLNRPGRSAGALDGASSMGMNITFDDSALSDIHTAIPMSGGLVNGTYQPDGRETGPYNTLDTDARTAMLSDFIGLNASGNWTLFIADQSSGETSTLESWSLTITGVPEPSTAVLVFLSAATLLRRRR